MLIGKHLLSSWEKVNGKCLMITKTKKKKFFSSFQVCWWIVCSLAYERSLSCLSKYMSGKNTKINRLYFWFLLLLLLNFCYYSHTSTNYYKRHDIFVTHFYLFLKVFFPVRMLHAYSVQCALNQYILHII